MLQNSGLNRVVIVVQVVFCKIFRFMVDTELFFFSKHYGFLFFVIPKK